MLNLLRTYLFTAEITMASVSDGNGSTKFNGSDNSRPAARTLTADEVEHLQTDKILVSEFKQKKLEKEAEKNWDLFYKRNTTKFFKDRHWTKREFEELVNDEEDAGKTKVVFEVGCGVGNFMFPLLEEDDSKSLFIYACDFSKRAVQFVKAHSSYDDSRCCAFHADITTTLSSSVPDSSVDIATMIFVLSAVHPDKMVLALGNVFQTLKPGGVLLFRDYGLYDYAMLRFAPGHKLSEHFYVRQDGTRAFYFSLDFLEEIAKSAGFQIGQIQYVHRDTVNKKEGVCVPRIFVQARFVKPQSSSSTGSTMCRDKSQNAELVSTMDSSIRESESHNIEDNVLQGVNDSNCCVNMLNDASQQNKPCDGKHEK